MELVPNWMELLELNICMLPRELDELWRHTRNYSCFFFLQRRSFTHTREFGHRGRAAGDGRLYFASIKLVVIIQIWLS